MAEAERRRLEEALRVAEERFRALVDNSPVAVWHIAVDGRTLYANRVLLPLLEVETVEDVLGRRYQEFFPPESLRVIEREHARRRRGESSRYEVDMVGRRGTRRRILICGGPVMDAEGRLTGMIGTILDVTEERRHDAERRSLDQQRQRARSLESLGVLAGGVAHDFNNLLVGILGNASLALDKLGPDAPVRPVVERIVTAAHRATELTDQMLAYAGHGTLRMQQVDLTRLVRETAQLLEVSLPSGVDLTLDLDREMPLVEGDPTQIRQVVMNLIQNAADAIEDGTGEVTVRTALVPMDREALSRAYLGDGLPAGRYACVEVQDDGCGMEPAVQARIFEPFFTTKARGRGLGLAAVLGIVRGHRGAVHLESRSGQGSRFRVLFPVPVPAVPRSVTPAHGVAMLPRRVLVVDDEEAVRAFCKAALEDAGFEVMTAADGQEGVAAVRRRGGEIALVILDVSMPGMSGEEAFRRMRALRADLCVVLCSGYAEQEATERFVDGGVRGFLQKPFRASELVAKVRTAMAGARV